MGEAVGRLHHQPRGAAAIYGGWCGRSGVRNGCTGADAVGERLAAPHQTRGPEARRCPAPRPAGRMGAERGCPASRARGQPGGGLRLPARPMRALRPRARGAWRVGKSAPATTSPMQQDEGEHTMTKGSDLLVAALENEGVDRVFGVPGEENLDVVEALRTSGIKLVLTRHEQPAAFMAATHGRLTGKPGVCLSTLGPGALNLVTGAAYAHLGAMPMVMITGQKGIMGSRQARFQMVDTVAAMKPLTKMTRQIVGGATIPTLVRDAFRTAQEERPGPVHLELPEDVAGEAVADPPPLVPSHPVEIPVAHRAALDRAAEMILAAERSEERRVGKECRARWSPY